MAGQSKTTTTAAKRKPPAQKPVDARDGLSLADLARGILSKEIRSRAEDVRRLAEAVLTRGAKPKKSRKADGGKKKDKGNRKLAKIPGQQAKK